MPFKSISTTARMLLFQGLLLTPLLAAPHVWVEGETGKAKNLSRNGWYLDVRPEDLSGEKWLASYGSSAPVLVDYTVKVPAEDTYIVWVRANPIGARLHVKVNGATTWTDVPISSAKQDNLNVARDGKPDMRFLAWTKLEQPLPLKEGNLDLQFRFSSKSGNHGAIDCFCLTADASWKPQKTLRPGQTRSWPAPKLTDKNLQQWIDFIRPTKDDLAWRGVRWHRHLDEAAAEAKKLGRPVLLWAMNGHPCGET